MISVYDSLHFGTKNIPTSFVFLLRRSCFPDWVHLFLHQYQKNIPALLCGMTVEITAVNLNSQQKLYHNGASAFLRRLTAVSAELPAVLEKERRISKKFQPGQVRCSQISWCKFERGKVWNK